MFGKGRIKTLLEKHRSTKEDCASTLVVCWRPSLFVFILKNPKRYRANQIIAKRAGFNQWWEMVNKQAFGGFKNVQ